MPQAASGVELVVIAAYLLVLVGAGYGFRKLNSNVSDFFRAGCRGTWWLVGASVFMTTFSAWTFTGASGVAFEAGWAVAIIYLANAAGYLVNAIFLAPWFRQLRAITVPEVIRMRFGTGTQQFYALFSVLTGLLYSGLHLYGLAIFSSAVFGYDITLVILIVGIVVVVYATAGGSWAVMATDVLQSLILLPMTLLLAVLCLVEVGGVGGLFGLIESRGVGDDFKLIHDPGRFDANQFTLLWAAAMFLKTAFAYNGLAAASRYFAVKDGAAARKAALVAMVGMLVGITIWLLPPVTARLLYEDAVLAAELAKPAESSYAIASVMLLPTGLVGLMVAAMFAATMSSMDSGLNKNAAIITQDLYPLISRLRGHGEREGAGRLRLAKVISLALGATVISLALFFAGIEGRGAFGIMLTVGAMLALPLAVPLLLCLFIKRVPGWSAMAAAGAALIPSIIGYFQGWNFQTQVLVNVVVGVAAFFACMPAWRFAPPAYRDKVDAFFTRMHTPVDFEQEVGQSSDRQQLNIIGGFALIIGSAILLLLLLPNPWLGRLGILFVAGTLLLVGTLMRWYGRGAAHPVQDPSATPQPLPDLA